MNAINKTTGSDSAVSIYGTSKPLLEETMQMVLREITKIRNEMTEELGMDPIEHLLGRIKSEESMREKCRRKGLPETPESALEKIHDALHALVEGVVCMDYHFVEMVQNRHRKR